ncbi:MAG: glycoside hydrolase family 2 protein [Spirochaetota bacterium]
MSMHTARPRTSRSLDGIWAFAWLGDSVDLSHAAVADGTPHSTAAFDRRVAVPGCFDTLPGLAGERGTAAYRTRFEQGDEAVGILHFDGLGIWAAVYIDDALVYVHRKPYSPFTVEVPAADSDSRVRELTLVVDNRFDTERSPLQENYFDFYAYGGIFRPVAYVPLPAVHITNVRVTTTAIDPPTIDIAVDANTDVNVELHYLVDGKDVSATDTVDGTGTEFAHQLPLPGYGLWSPESPEMHTLTVTLDAGASHDEFTVAFGLRTIEVDGPELRLNGRPLKLFGWNRHESHAQFGPALPLQQMVGDIELMKRAGANFVRGSHYPQDDRFLDLCDEMGMLVWEESIGWQQNETHFANSDYQSLIGEQQIEMIEAHFNHPSIIMWGFQNELHSELATARPVIENLVAITRKADPTRPITFASCRFPNDLCLDLVDIISLNVYPGWYAGDVEEYRPLEEIGERLDAIRAGLAKQGLADRPLIISEIGAGAIYGWRDPHAGHWSEQYQSDYLGEICSQFRGRADVMGLALWQFCDCRTYGSSRALGRPRGFNNKGIVDEYRRPKQAYELVRALMTEVDA